MDTARRELNSYSSQVASPAKCSDLLAIKPSLRHNVSKAACPKCRHWRVVCRRSDQEWTAASGITMRALSPPRGVFRCRFLWGSLLVFTSRCAPTLSRIGGSHAHTIAFSAITSLWFLLCTRRGNAAPGLRCWLTVPLRQPLLFDASISAALLVYQTSGRASFRTPSFAVRRTFTSKLRTRWKLACKSHN